MLSPRFDAALLYAHELHGAQVKKGTTVPYLAHLLGVTALVLEDGGGEDEAIAALLHDAAEDQGGTVILDEIHRRFGEGVAAIVEGCTDTVESPKPPWRERKEAYVAHLRAARPETLRVSLADKLHNARSILADYRQIGDEIWSRFSGGKEGVLWYFGALLATFQECSVSPMVGELGRVVAELKRLEREEARR